MKRWCITAAVVGSKHIGYVLAETRLEAEGLAWQLPECDVTLCHQCSDECEDPAIEDLVVTEVEEAKP